MTKTLSILILAAMALGCAADHPQEPERRAVDLPECSFSTVLGAWEDAFRERVPPECELLDREYDVAEVDEVLCDDAEPRHHELVIGCTKPAERAIYILKTREEPDKLDTLGHEWIHALSDCVIGDRDAAHLRAGLWASGGAKSVEILAAADIGRCLAPSRPSDKRRRPRRTGSLSSAARAAAHRRGRCMGASSSPHP